MSSVIKAKILADSISQAGIRLTTFELEYPRIIHSEILTHKMLSRNSASSRAIPFNKMVKNLRGIPVQFNKNQSGMQGGEVWDEPVVFDKESKDEFTTYYAPETAWRLAKDTAVVFAKAFSDAGYHKQIFNRIVEPYQMMKTVVSSTERSNFFWLRDDDAADPTIQALARKMREAHSKSVPKTLKAGEWHLPYITDEELTEYGLDVAIKMSVARCAAVSYRNEDYTMEKCLEIYSSKIVGGEKIHGSAAEHQATPIPILQGYDLRAENWPDGVTHMDKDSQLWSANFRGWIQYRKLIPGENYDEYALAKNCSEC